MSRFRRFAGRRVVIVGGGALAASCAAAILASSAFAATPAEVQAKSAPAVAGTPCTAAARACVDLGAQKAWLISPAGKVLRGPVPISTGGPGRETPTGDVFRVYRKDKDHKSEEFKLPNGQPAPMPYSVFFADGGIAFHAGDPARASSGCIHLNTPDAVAFFNTLQIGDHVQVKNGSQNSGDDNSGDDNSGHDDDDSGDHHHDSDDD
jgi:hypothetical protein